VKRAAMTVVTAAAVCSTVTACASPAAGSSASGPKQLKADVSEAHVITAALRERHG
jgi:hypothetical protein